MGINSLKDKLLKHKFFSEFFTPSSLKQFKRYLITGFTSFGIEYTMYYLLHRILLLDYLTANVIVYVVIFWINFLLNKFWSFKSQTNFIRQLKLYLVLFIFNLVVANVFIMYLLTDILGIDSMLTKVMVMGFVVSWNFILYKKVIYK